MSPSALARQVQSDWGGGMQPDIARHLISERSAFDVTNGLYDDDGSIYRRGGATYLTDEDFGTAMRAVWDGHFASGHRTFFASPENFGIVDPNDGVSPLSLGGDGMTEPYPMVQIQGMLFIAGPTLGHSYIYGGSEIVNTYTIGTVSVTEDSTTVTGAGTSWLTNVAPGGLFKHGTERVYVVESIETDTSLTLAEPYEGATDTGEAYAIYALYEITASDPYEPSTMYAVGGNRLLRAEGNRVYMAGRNLTTGVSQPHLWVATDYHEFPEGVEVVNLNSVADSAVAVTTQGIWTIQGLSYEIVDDLGNFQHRLDNINKEISGWHRMGVAAWQTGLIIPCQDAIYLLDPVAGLRSLSEAVESRYRHYVQTGHQPGGATIYNEHYLLPILNSSLETVDVLCCRLDRAADVRGQVAFPWSRLRESGALVAQFAARRTGTAAPALIGAANQAEARLLRCESYWEPDDEVKADPDGTNFVLNVITRDYQTGVLNKNRVRKVRLTYELSAADGDDPTVIVDEGHTGASAEGTLWGHFLWGAAPWSSAEDAGFSPLEGGAPEDNGENPYTWHINLWLRRIRFRIRSSGPCAKLTLRHLELFSAQSQNVRH